MSTIDLVFEGGGAKGMVFVGALEELLKDGTRAPGRLLGTSAGGHHRRAAGRRLYPGRDGRHPGGKGRPTASRSLPRSWPSPRPSTRRPCASSDIGKLLAELDLPLVPDALGESIDSWIARRLAGSHARAAPALLCGRRGLVLGRPVPGVDRAQAERGPVSRPAAPFGRADPGRVPRRHRRRDDPGRRRHHRLAACCCSTTALRRACQSSMPCACP